MVGEHRNSIQHSHSELNFTNSNFQFEAAHWGHIFFVLIILIHQANSFATGTRGVANGFFERDIRTQSRSRVNTRRIFGQFQIRLNIPYARARFRGAEQRGRTRRRYEDELMGISAPFEISEMI